jgi:hypothetical protein
MMVVELRREVVMVFLIVCVLATLIFLLSLSRARINTTSSNDWLVLVSFEVDRGTKIRRHGAVTRIEFVPIVGWEFHREGRITPVTHSEFAVGYRLKVSEKHSTSAYWVRDGAAYELSGLRVETSDLWVELKAQVLSGHDLTVNGTVPDPYHERISEIQQIQYDRWKEQHEA